MGSIKVHSSGKQNPAIVFEEFGYDARLAKEPLNEDKHQISYTYRRFSREVICERKQDKHNLNEG